MLSSSPFLRPRESTVADSTSIPPTAPKATALPKDLDAVIVPGEGDVLHFLPDKYGVERFNRGDGKNAQQRDVVPPFAT